MKHPQRKQQTSAPKPGRSTSWEPVQKWYNKTVGDSGHYYHEHIVIPGVLRLLGLTSAPASLLDIACGQGILGRSIPRHVEYMGVDISPSLIKNAKSQDPLPNHGYMVGDALKPLPLKKQDFSHAAIVLAIQNMEHPKQAFENASRHLVSKGHLVIAMNHPCFRIPRQSSWKIDEEQKTQYRRIDRYSSPLDIPIQANPSKGEESVSTWSFHRSLADYSRWLYEAGFLIELIEEWHSDKESTGKAAKMENRCREEIPLFLAIKALKI
ncbi:MAG: class I SAM-dependent methyltransferase [Parachlamydiaceae bacterium]